MSAGSDPFLLDGYLALPRVSGLALSLDGRRLVTTVALLSPDGKRFITSLWELDRDGVAEPRRITRSTAGETLAGFAAGGALLFTSSRRDPEARPDTGDSADPDPVGLWSLPANGGEAAAVLVPPGGVEGVAIARDVPALVLAVPVFPGATPGEQDAERARKRKEAGVTAQLFETFPVRYWDHYLGPRQRRLLWARLDVAGDFEPRDLTPEARGELFETGYAISPDGGTVVSATRRGIVRTADLVAIDTATGERRLLAAAEGEHLSPAISPDGTRVACVRDLMGSVDRPGRARLFIIGLSGGEGFEPLPDLPLLPLEPVWAPDSSALFFTADEHGNTPVFRLDIGGGLTRLSREGCFSSLCVAPDGSTVYAIRSTPWSPPGVVAIDAHAADQAPRVIPSPSPAVQTPGEVSRVAVPAARGHSVEGWLTVPRQAAGDTRIPLVLMIHGGPLSSWTGWSWRWNAHLLARQGYAVLALDPALSTGYGWEHIDRGWSRWSEETAADLLEGLDAVLAAHPELDAGRIAAMGGSFGGHMTNWLAGHTDRFAALISHAATYALDQMHGTTDLGTWMEEFFGDPYTADGERRFVANSPNRSIAGFGTPMLVIHGELDYRVPLGEALRLWTDLARHDVPARFLYFPDENHWILKPPNVRIWYEAVLAFLDEHLRGRPWRRPELL